MEVQFGRYEQAEDYFKKADQLKPKEPIVLIVRAINLSRLGCLDEGYEILNRINMILESENMDEIEKRTNLRKGNLKWIKTSLIELSKVVDLNKEKFKMSKKQQEDLKEINREYFAAFLDVENREGDNN